jgi:hypothetical protein
MDLKKNLRELSLHSKLKRLDFILKTTAAISQLLLATLAVIEQQRLY